MNISQKTTDIGPPIWQPSIRFNNFPMAENTHPFINLRKSFCKIDFFHKGFYFFLNINLVYYIINGLFCWNTCKEGSTSYETSSYSSELVEFFIKSGKVNVSLIVNSFLAKRLSYIKITFEARYIIIILSYIII